MKRRHEQVAIALPPEHVAAMRERALERRVATTVLYREAVAEYLEGLDAVAAASKWAGREGGS